MCYIHDYHAAQCPRCQHREFIFPIKESNGLSPEALQGHDTETRCEFCGALCITVPKVTPYCPCKRCKTKGTLEEESGIRTNRPFECECGKEWIERKKN